MHAEPDVHYPLHIARTAARIIGPATFGRESGHATIVTQSSIPGTDANVYMRIVPTDDADAFLMDSGVFDWTQNVFTQRTVRPLRVRPRGIADTFAIHRPIGVTVNMMPVVMSPPSTAAARRAEASAPIPLFGTPLPFGAQAVSVDANDVESMPSVSIWERARSDLRAIAAEAVNLLPAVPELELAQNRAAILPMTPDEAFPVLEVTTRNGAPSNRRGHHSRRIIRFYRRARVGDRAVDVRVTNSQGQTTHERTMSVLDAQRMILGIDGVLFTKVRINTRTHPQASHDLFTLAEMNRVDMYTILTPPTAIGG
jgi:hypothetical protein